MGLTHSSKNHTAFQENTENPKTITSVSRPENNGMSERYTTEEIRKGSGETVQKKTALEVTK